MYRVIIHSVSAALENRY